ncbi:unnamed protein product [marine sediment metagenome]|uniref:Uncharacterized protein n=1 Tax=marine sediment metagenome TaxID=412755 RepID=X0YUC6_9ZZZZ
MPVEDTLGVLEKAIEQYKPGGAFARTRAEQLAEKKATVVPSMRAELVGRGLAGTTVGAGIPAAYEQQVAKPWRTETEMLRGQRLMDAIMAKAGVMERTETREMQERMAKEERDLREKLAKAELSSRERQAALSRLATIRAGRAERGTGGNWWDALREGKSLFLGSKWYLQNYNSW